MTREPISAPERGGAPTDLLGYAADLLTDVEREKLASLRELLELRARPHMSEWWEAAESPAHLRGELAALRLEDDPELLDENGATSPYYDGFKNFEFQLARAINAQKEGVRVGRTGDVPPAYRALVDEYYREIGKTPGAKKPPM